MRIALQIACDDSADLPTRRAFSHWANSAARQSGRSVAAGTELSVRLVDLAEGARLNREFRGKRGATNVLSFPFEQAPGVELPLLGDVVVCAPVIRREADAQGKPLQAHFAHMMVHATLHLLGYDHDDETSATAMETLETRVLARLGYPDPYQPATGR